MTGWPAVALTVFIFAMLSWSAVSARRAERDADRRVVARQRIDTDRPIAAIRREPKQRAS